MGSISAYIFPVVRKRLVVFHLLRYCISTGLFLSEYPAPTGPPKVPSVLRNGMVGASVIARSPTGPPPTSVVELTCDVLESCTFSPNLNFPLNAEVCEFILALYLW